MDPNPVDPSSPPALPPAILPKITLPAWAYVAVVIVIGPIAMAWLLDADIKKAAATALAQTLALIGVASVAVPKIKATALAHRQFNLGAGFVAGSDHAVHEMVSAAARDADEQESAAKLASAKKAPAKARTTARTRKRAG